MKKSVIYAALLLGASTTSVFAGNGTINFKGEIVNSSCDVTSDSKNINVNLGRWATTALSASGQTTSPQTFSINMDGCVAGNYTVRLDGTADSHDQNLLALDPSSTAKNVGIRVTGLDDKLVPLNQSLDNSFTFTVDGKDGEKKTATAQLKAFYVASGDAATEGSADATAKFSIEYK